MIGRYPPSWDCLIHFSRGWIIGMCYCQRSDSNPQMSKRTLQVVPVCGGTMTCDLQPMDKSAWLLGGWAGLHAWWQKRSCFGNFRECKDVLLDDFLDPQVSMSWNPDGWPVFCYYLPKQAEAGKRRGGNTLQGGGMDDLEWELAGFGFYAGTAVSSRIVSYCF